MEKRSHGWFGKSFVVLFLLLLVMQIVPVDRTNPPVTGEISTPENVRMVLRRACYDCHSNVTTWPWYSRVAPISFLVYSDVAEGREELNFSTWDSYSPERQTKKFKEIVDEVEEGEMPPWQYTLMHPEAKLSTEDKEILKAWVAVARK